MYRGPVDLSNPATSIARVMASGVLREFTSGPLWASDIWTKHRGLRFDEEYAFQGGTLRMGKLVQTGQDEHGRFEDRLLLAVWFGQQHSLLTHLYSAGSAEALRLMKAVQITEHADGVVIAPRQAAQAAFSEPVRSGKLVPGLGMVDARSRETQSLRGLPSWQGARVQSGELFRDTFGNGRPYLVLATPTAVVTVVPSAEANLDEVVEKVARFSVEARA